MVAPDLERLLVLAPALGVTSETFIGRHCTDLSDGRISYGTFRVDHPSTGWDPSVTTILDEAPKPMPSLVSRLRDRLRPRRLRHAHRDVRWVSDAAIQQLTNHVDTHRPVAVILEYLDRWLNAIPLLKGAGLRIVVHGHGYDVSSSLRNPATVAAYRRHLAVADSVVVPSHHAAARLRQIGLTNVLVIPYGVPLGPPPSPRGVSPGPVRLIAVGRLVAKKDPVGLVKAVARARETGADCHLDLFGDGPLRRRVERAVEASSLTDAVRLHGEQSNTRVISAMRAADVFLQRSVVAVGGDEEGLPLAILEAMAAGLPVVSTVHAGIPEAVVDGATGLLRAESDAAGFATAIARYCRDVDLRRSHGEEGRRRAERHYSWERNRTDLRNALGLAGRSSLREA